MPAMESSLDRSLTVRPAASSCVWLPGSLMNEPRDAPEDEACGSEDARIGSKTRVSYVARSFLRRASVPARVLASRCRSLWALSLNDEAAGVETGERLATRITALEAAGYEAWCRVSEVALLVVVVRDDPGHCPRSYAGMDAGAALKERREEWTGEESPGRRGCVPLLCGCSSVARHRGRAHTHWPSVAGLQ